ncbi:MAG: hypothetical protein EOP84_18610, partial [Verrucomicrobiaceae bacterium]
ANKTGSAIAAEITAGRPGETGTFEGAADLLSRGQFESAANAFRKVAATSPATGTVRPKALLYSGIAELFAGRRESAKASLRELGKLKAPAGPGSEKLTAFYANIATLNESDAAGLAAFIDRFDKETHEALGLLVVGLQSWHEGEPERAASMLRAYRSAEAALRRSEWNVELRGPVTSLLGQTASFQLLMERSRSNNPEDKIAALQELQTIQGPYAIHAQKRAGSLQAEIEAIQKKYEAYPRGGAYRLVNKKTGKAMEVAGGSKENDARVEQGKPDAAKIHQEWLLWPEGYGVYRFEARHTGKLLDLFNNSPDDGTFIGQWQPSDGMPQQRWKMEQHPDKSFSVIAPSTGKVIAVRGDSEIVQLTDKGAAEHRWTLEPLSPAVAALPAGEYMMLNVQSSFVIDVKNIKNEDGAQLVQWHSNNGKHQRFRVTPVEDGFYKLEAVHSGKVMDVNNTSTEDGAQVHQWTWRDLDNQKWKITHEGNARYRLSPKHAQDKVLAGFQDRRSNLLCCVAAAGPGMQEDRTGFGIGLQFGERAIGEDEQLLAFIDVAEAVAARMAGTSRHHGVGPEAVGVGAADPDRFGVKGGHCFETDGHGALSFGDAQSFEPARGAGPPVSWMLTAPGTLQARSATAV